MTSEDATDLRRLRRLWHGAYAISVTDGIWVADVGSPNVNLTLFNFQSAALPSIGIFENLAAVCQSYDPSSVPCVIGG